MQFNTIRVAIAALAILGLAGVANAVEGAGSYRGSGVVLPHYTNTANVRTFFRFINAFDRRENTYNETTDEGVDLDQASIFVHITYLRRVDGSSFDDLCDEQNFFFFMTKNDYKLLDVRSDPEAGAPGGFQEGYAVAWAVHNVGIGGFFEGQPGRKVYHNHLAADEVTVDLVNGRAWGTNASAFRASVEDDNTRPDGDCDPGDSDCDNDYTGGDDPGDWFDEQSDSDEYAILGFFNAADQASTNPGFELGDHMQYENIRYPERFFATVMSSRVNIQGARSSGSRYIVVPISYIQDTDLDNDGSIDGDDDCTTDDGDQDECQERSVWVPSTLPSSMAYVNRYLFDVRAFRHDESRISAPNQEAICYRDYTAAQITAGVTDSSSFRGPFPNVEEWQGWLDIEGRGFGQLPLLNRPASFDYYNRALLVQVDNVNFGRNVQWGFYPAHDRTTAELNPDPTTYNAHGVGGADETEPNTSPQYD